MGDSKNSRQSSGSASVKLSGSASVKPTGSASLQHSLAQALPFMPVSRKLTKRGTALTLDALLDDFRSQQNFSAGALDFLLMAYRYGHFFRRERTAFREGALKPAELEDLLQLSFGALLSRDRIPPAVTVSEAVEFAKRTWGAHTSGLTNAFLRGVVRKLDTLKNELQSRPEILLGPELLERWKAHPKLCRRMAEQLSQRPEAGFTAFDPQARFGRISIGEINSGRKLQAMNEASWLFMNWLVEKVAQDTKAGGAPLRYLDACAAPGGKLLAAMSLFEARGLDLRFTATEAKFGRFQRLNENLARWSDSKHGPVETLLKSWGSSDQKSQDSPSLREQSFDVILADLPCSGSGTLGTRPDILFGETLNERVKDLRALQSSILADLTPYLSPGAFFFVSICSVDPQEIAQITKALNGQGPSFSSFEADSAAQDPHLEGITGWCLRRA
jgi:16S rRNA (cytosine967-C5)-methyltransferase